MTSWLVDHWFDIFVPLLAFITVAALGLWAKWTVHKFLEKQQQKWVGNIFVIEAIGHSFPQWIILLGAYAAIQFSILTPAVKRLTGESLASIFALSLIWSAFSLSEKLIRFYLGRTKAMQSLISVALCLARIIITVTGIMVILDIWGAHTLPIIIVLIAALFIIGFAFRNTFDNLLAGFDIIYGEHIKVGHLIKLESGEVGHITQISWMRTTIRISEDNLVIIPNHKLMANSIVNYGADSTVNTAKDSQSDLATVEMTRLIETLSDREREVLKLVSLGSTNREIAEQLIISEHTVKSHIHSILSKLNIHNRQQAAVFAEREGLLAMTDAVKTDS